MELLFQILTVLLILIMGVWASRHRQISSEQTNGKTLSPEYPGELDDPPLVSVIVSAKDEESCVEKCINSMLTQDYPNFEVIACNDRSDDRTGEILDQLAAQDNRLTAMHIDHLPEKWFGKPHAMQHAIKEARGEWLCMIDADCWQSSPHSLSATLKFAHDKQADMISALPQMEMNTFWENVIQPVCSAIMMIWFKPDKVNNPKKENAYANGAFILVKKEVFQKVGTFEAISGHIMEDMHLGRIVKSSGHSLCVIRTDGLYKVRMYTNLKDILNGWTRIFFGSFATFPKIFLSLLFLVIFSILPYIALATSLVFINTGGWAKILALVSVAAVCLQFSVIYRYQKLLGGIPMLAVTYFLGCIMAVVTLIRAMCKLKKGAKLTWKNTTYSTAQPK